MYLYKKPINRENRKKKKPAWFMEDCMSFAFSNCGSTLLHHFKGSERKGGKP